MPQTPTTKSYASISPVEVDDAGRRFFRHVTIEVDNISVNCDGDGVLPAGTFIAENGATAGQYLAYARLMASVAAPANQTFIEFARTPSVFFAGQDLQNAAGTTIGTVQDVDYENNRVNLTGTGLTAALAVGDTVKLPDATHGALVGVLIKDHVVKGPHGEDTVAVYDGAKLYSARMPYLDAAIRTQFEDIRYWD